MFNITIIIVKSATNVFPLVQLITTVQLISSRLNQSFKNVNQSASQVFLKYSAVKLLISVQLMR